MVEHLVESQQLNSNVLFKLFRKADELRESSFEVIGGLLKDKILATLFYEPSTRTRLSFESAMLKLGGRVISTENAKEFSSAAKGESIEDTVRVVGAYADCIVIRHYEERTLKKAVGLSQAPIINAGEGKGQHPTQAILDAYTIYRELGRLDNFKIAMVGDLASGRTVRSLCYLLGKFSGIEIIFVSPENLKMKEDIKAYLKENGLVFKEETNLNSVLPYMDIVYMTRIQKERISQEDYEKAKSRYVISKENLDLVKPITRIMHPLPHCEEIDLAFEIEKNDKRIAYFKQAENGLYIRMALLLFLLRDGLFEN